MNKYNQQIRLTKLDSGLVVITEFIPSVESVAVGVWVDSGSAHENEQEYGIAHLLEHMIFRGSRSYTARKFASVFENDGGSVNAYTSKETTVFSAHLLSENLPAALDALADALFHPKLSLKDIEQEKQIILEEITETLDNPEDLLFDQFFMDFYNHPAYGHPILGSVASLEAISRDVLERYWQKNFQPANMVISLAGSVNHDLVVGQISRRFTTGVTAVAVRPEINFSLNPPFTTSRHSHFNQSHIGFGLTAGSYAGSELYPLLLINNYLGEGLGSYLFRRLREEKGYVYTVYSQLEFMKSHCVFTIYASTDLTKLTATRKELNRLMKEFWSAGLETAEVLKLKRQLRGLFLLGLENSENRMMRNLKNFVYKGQVTGIEETVALIDNVTTDQVNVVISERFNPERQWLFILEPA